MLIISNNPMTWERYPDSVKVAGTSLDVMEEARNRVQGGMRLLAHPISGNGRLVRNPFRSVVFHDGISEVDPQDLFFVEDSYYRLKQVEGGLPPDSTLEDYQIIDLDLLTSILEQQ